MDSLYTKLKFFEPALLLGTIGFSVYYFQDVYLCLLSGIILANCLYAIVNPIYSLLKTFMPFQKTDKLVWTIALIVAILLFVIGFIFLISVITPSLVMQYENLSTILTKEETYSGIIDSISNLSKTPFFVHIQDFLEPNLDSIGNKLLLKAGMLSKNFLNRIGVLLSSLVYSAHNLLTIVLSFVLAFHIVREWSSWGDRLKKLQKVPFFKPYSNKIQTFTTFCATGIQSWIQGQVIVSLILSVYFSICFSILKVSSPILVGFIFGCVSFIPYISDLIGFTALGIALSTSHASLITILLSIGSVFIGHGLSSYILAPLLIGKTTNLNPVQVVLGFLLHIKLFGLVGMLLNIPFCVITNGLLKVIFEKDTEPAIKDDVA